MGPQRWGSVLLGLAAGPEPWLTSSIARGIWGKEAKGTELNEDSFQNGV